MKEWVDLDIFRDQFIWLRRGKGMSKKEGFH
jgi:hypothetical protein